MANLKSSKKRALQNEKRRQVNQARKSEVKTLTKKHRGGTFNVIHMQREDSTTARTH
ncbi:30S ribosomal protein S20 [bacterium]|nr:30S ribosomal protein S20 [bacterium]